MSRSPRRLPELRVLPGAREEARAESVTRSPSAAGASMYVARAVPSRSRQDSTPEGDPSHALEHSGSDRAVSDRTVSDRTVSDRAETTSERLERLGDAQLVALTRAGDRAAFEALYRRHAAFALNLAVRIQGRLEDVEDVVHDAFLRAHHQIDRLRDDATFRSWLAAIVVSLVRSRLRRVRLLKTLGLVSAEPIDLDALAADGAGPETRALLAQIYGALRRLPVDQRIAWTLRYVERHSLPDVAEIVGCSLATAKRRIAAAQSLLSEVLGETNAPEGSSSEGLSPLRGGLLD